MRKSPVVAVPATFDPATQAVPQRLVEDLYALIPGQAQETVRSLRLHAEHEARAHLHIKKKDRGCRMR